MFRMTLRIDSKYFREHQLIGLCGTETVSNTLRLKPIFLLSRISSIREYCNGGNVKLEVFSASLNTENSTHEVKTSLVMLTDLHTFSTPK
jgi:hypothetical protein